MAKDLSVPPVGLLPSLDDVTSADLLYSLGNSGDAPVDQDVPEESARFSDSDSGSDMDGGDPASDSDALAEGGETTITVDGVDLSYIPPADGFPTSFDWASSGGSGSIEAEYETQGWSTTTSGCSCPMCGGTFGDDGSAGGDLGAPAPAATLNTLANYLNERNSGSTAQDFWDQFDGNADDDPAPFWNLTAAGANAQNGQITFTLGANWRDGDGLAGATRQEAIRNALDVYEDVLGINFVEVANANADLVFQDNVFTSTGGERAFANFDLASNGSITRAWINITPGWSGNGTIGDYFFETALHEIGHTLGLGHQGLYNAGSGSPTYANDAQWVNDTVQFSMMSYWAQSSYTQPGSGTPNNGDLIGPQIVDWIALNRIYNPQGFGIDDGATTGNTTWGFNSSWIDSTTPPQSNLNNDAFSRIADLLDTDAVCIVDGGGIDTLDLSGFSNSTLIDLRTNSASSTTVYFSNVAGQRGNLSTAVGTVIENAIGGSGSEAIHGNSAANVLTGNLGNDTMYGYSGIDTLYGGDGNDSLYGGGTNGDWLDGGVGNDRLFGGLNRQTLIGGTGNDTIYGDDVIPTSGVGDYIVAGEGLDFVYGANGDDTIYGGSGNDSVRGGDGYDTIYGDSGTDTLRGEDGNDVLMPNSGITNGEVYDGGAGIDRLDFTNLGAGYSVDLTAGFFNFFNRLTGLTQTTLISIENVSAGNGNDTVTGDGAANVLEGGGGNDNLRGESNSDTLYGGDGNDTIYGGGDQDELYGGLGIDTANFNTTSVAGVFDLTGGTAFFAGFYTEIMQGFENLVGTTGADTVYGGNDANRLDGEVGNDLIYGNLGADTLLGNDGDDTLYGGGDQDELFGGNGIDTAVYDTTTVAGVFDLTAGTAFFAGFYTEAMQGIENVVGTTGSDQILGSVDANRLEGIDGNDLLDGGAGIDTLYGGIGNDTAIGGADADWLDGGFDIDTVSYASSLAAVNVLLNSATNSGGDAAGDTLVGFEYLIGSSFNDTLHGNDNDGATIEGGAGRDSIVGGFNSQTLYGGVGNDTIIGGESETPTSVFGDVIYGGDGNDRVIGANGDDSVWGGIGSDNIKGNGGKDYIDGENASDVVDGGADNDTLFGSNGTDTLNGGDDNDLMYGGNDNDTLRGDNGDDLIFGDSGDDNLSGGAGLDTMYGGIGNDTLSGEGSDDWLFGDDGNDSLNGGAGNDAMYGGASLDYLAGANGNDTLYGEGGNDTLDGGGNIDVLYGGAGTDSLTGGAAADTFVWLSAVEVGNGAGRDVVTDFVSGQDKLNFAAIQGGMTFIGVDVAFTGAVGEIRYMSALNQLQCQLDGVGAVDFSLTLAGVLSITGADLILV